MADSTLMIKPGHDAPEYDPEYAAISQRLSSISISSLVVMPYIRGGYPPNFDRFGCFENNDFLYTSTLGRSKTNSPWSNYIEKSWRDLCSFTLS